MKKYLLGLLSGILLSLVFYGGITLIHAFRTIGRAIEEGPDGGGSFLISPDGTMIAKIDNKYEDKKNGLPPYYVFSVDTHTNVTIRSRMIRAVGSSLDFRSRRAEDWISWSPDSTSVKFMDDNVVLWKEDFQSTENEAEQAAPSNR